MNVKSLTPTITQLDTRLRTEAKDAVKLKNSSERDADGRQQQSQEEPKRHLTEVEFEVAIKNLKENSGVVAHNLNVRVETHADHRVVFIEDQSGKVIRRLSEADLWLVTRDSDRPTGALLDRAG